jgi:hypothetical protein
MTFHFILFYIFFASYASCDLSQNSRGCDEPRSYSHNAVGLAAADRTQRPVDAASAEDEDAYPRRASTPVWETNYPISGNLPFADSFGQMLIFLNTRTVSTDQLGCGHTRQTAFCSLCVLFPLFPACLPPLLRVPNWLGVPACLSGFGLSWPYKPALGLKNATQAPPTGPPFPSRAWQSSSTYPRLSKTKSEKGRATEKVDSSDKPRRVFLGSIRKG